MRSILMAAALAAATSTALADGTDEDLRALIEQQQRQIELLQQQLDATRGVLEELGEIPSGKASLKIGRHILTVLEIKDNKIARVLVKPERLQLP